MAKFSSPGARLAADRVWSVPRMFRARKKLAGYRLVAGDAPWSAGEGLPTTVRAAR